MALPRWPTSKGRQRGKQRAKTDGLAAVGVFSAATSDEAGAIS